MSMPSPQQTSTQPHTGVLADDGYVRAGGTDMDAGQPFHFPGTERVRPEEVFSGPGYTSPRPPRNSVAQLALYLAPPSTFIPFLIPIVLILGVVGVVKSGENQRVGRRAALGALAIATLALILWVVLYLLIRYGEG